jgi:hypothetical protein
LVDVQDRFNPFAQIGRTCFFLLAFARERVEGKHDFADPLHRSIDIAGALDDGGHAIGRGQDQFCLRVMQQRQKLLKRCMGI